MFTNKNSHEHIKKLVKTLMEFFQKFVTLTENPINFDVTYSVILGTVCKGGIYLTFFFINDSFTIFFSVMFLRSSLWKQKPLLAPTLQLFFQFLLCAILLNSKKAGYSKTSSRYVQHECHF